MPWLRSNIIRVAAITVLALSVVLLLLLPAHDHDWMRQMDPTIGPGNIQDSSRNARVVTGLAGVAGTVAAMLIGFAARGRTARRLALGAGVLVAAIWWAKFG